jgi:nicotinate-nucleotide--dimethylbenzimidazole phosphoribosyltransferase
MNKVEICKDQVSKQLPLPKLTVPPCIQNSPLFERSQVLTMPPGALQNIIEPVLKITAANASNSVLAEAFLFAGDHATAMQHQISAFPSEITARMVENFCKGGAAMSVLARRRNIPLHVLDVGVAHPYSIPNSVDKGVLFHSFLKPKNHKQSYPQGARSIVDNSALLLSDALDVFEAARAWASNQVRSKKLNLILLGEMGIGNTTPSSALLTYVLGSEAEKAIGTGTGINSKQFATKCDVVRLAVERHHTQHGPWLPSWNNALAALSSLGGFELVAIAGAAIGAAENSCYFMLDGHIVTSALLPFLLAEPALQGWAMAAHKSAEPGHQLALQALNLEPLLKLNLRLGEGTGCALALGLIQDAQFLIENMATFSDFGD